jgi:hypothetical protein
VVWHHLVEINSDIDKCTREMRDEDGPTIADAFYEELFRRADGKRALEPDVTKSAKALHGAVQKLRSRNVSFRRWVAFIHMGK